MQADMLPVGDHAVANGRSNFDQFWFNVEALAMQNREQSVILSTMLFTLTIWVISALFLLLSCILYLVFLWHYIPDGNLSKFNKKKAEDRLETIVGKKVRKALAKEQLKQKALEQKALKSGKPMLASQPTLPSIDEKLPIVGLKRTDSNMTSTTTMSDTPSRTGTVSSARAPGLPGIDEIPQRPPMPSRSVTPGSTFSSASYNSNAPLLDNASSVGYSDPPIPRMPAAYGSRPGTSGSRGGPPSIISDSPIDRPSTAGSNRYIPNGVAQPYPNYGAPGAYPPGRNYPPSRPGTSGSYRPGQSPVNSYDQRQITYPRSDSLGQSYELSPVTPVQPAARLPGTGNVNSVYNIDDYYPDSQVPMPELPGQYAYQQDPGPRANQGYNSYGSNSSEPGRRPSLPLSGSGLPAGPRRPSLTSNDSGYSMPGQRREFSEPMAMPGSGPGRPQPPRQQMRSATSPYPPGRFAGNQPGNPLTPVNLRDSDPDVPAPLQFRGLPPGSEMPQPPRSQTAPLRGPMTRPPQQSQGLPNGPRSQSAKPWDGEAM